MVADSERAQLSVELFVRVDFSSGILETYLTSTTSESSVFTPCFFGSYSAIIGRIGVLCNRTEGDELKRMNYSHELADDTLARNHPRSARHREFVVCGARINQVKSK